MARSRKKKKLDKIVIWRRTVMTVLLGSVAGAVFLGIEWLRQPQTMPLRSVQIEGEFRHLTVIRLEEAVAAYVNNGFFSVDIDAVRAAVETLPWAYRASVRRVWPDSLRVRVTEQKALARWGEEGLVNESGELFVPAADTIPEGLPILYGPNELREQLVQQYHSLSKVAANVGRTITQLTQNQRRAWFMEWDNGVEWKLGRVEPYPRLLRFLRVYQTLRESSNRDLKTVDLRHSNGFAVQWGLQAGEEPGSPG